jgi:hypothetical protein
MCWVKLTPTCSDPDKNPTFADLRFLSLARRETYGFEAQLNGDICKFRRYFYIVQKKIVTT